MDLERRLAARFGWDHCVLVGRATTGLGVVFEAVGATEVVFPAYCCASPVYSTVYTDAEPRFCEVREDYNISPAHLRDRISVETDVVVGVDSWGTPIDVSPLQEICDEHDALLVEDAAQAVGSHSDDDRQTGSLGDVAVLSFGCGKPIDAGDGGAILTDDRDLAQRCRRAAETIPSRDDDHVQALDDRYTTLYWGIANSVRDPRRRARLFRVLPRAFEPVYWRGYDCEWTSAIEAALDRVDATQRARQRQVDLYRRELASTQFEVLPGGADTVPFAAIVRFADPKHRSRVRHRLVEDGFDAWWIEGPIWRRFGSDESFAKSRALYEQTLTLPLGPSLSTREIRDCATTFRRAADAVGAECATPGSS